MAHFRKMGLLLLLLQCGLAAGQNPNPNACGAAIDGLQIRIFLDQADGAQSKSPKFRVELRNAGVKDLLLKLGIMTYNGGRQYPTAISFILVDAQGNFQWLELKRNLPVGETGSETLSLPLPVGATFSFPVDLNDYWASTSKEFDYKLKAGTYRLAAHLNGFIRTDPPFPAVPMGGPERPPTVSVRTFDMVNPETCLGPPPMSNALQLEIPSQ